MIATDLTVGRAQLETLLHGASAAKRLVRCVFDDEDLCGLDLAGAEVVDCTFARTQLAKALLGNTRWQGCRGPGASFDLADLTDARFVRCDPNNSNWWRGKLSGASFDEVKLTGARFAEARTLGTTLRASLLVTADLRGWTFRKQNLEQLNLSGADLSGCDFSDDILIDCDITGASLKHTKFARADPRRAQIGPLQVGDLLQHFKGSVISVDQPAGLIAALGVSVI
jgi:hypothetical protein